MAKALELKAPFLLLSCESQPFYRNNIIIRLKERMMYENLSELIYDTSIFCHEDRSGLGRLNELIKNSFVT